MQLGVYRRPSIDDDDKRYVRLALYDFDAGEWVDGSDGNIVAKASADPSPEELKVRFDLDPNARRTIVAMPTVVAESEYPVEVGESDKTVAEGHAEREELGGPLMTQTEREAQRNAGLRVFPDDHEITDEDREFYEEDGTTPIHESQWNYDFADEFDIDFGPGSDNTSDSNE